MLRCNAARIPGTYHPVSTDSNTQNPKKFGNTFHSSVDKGAKRPQPINPPKDSGAV
jgi:hypothetical protein